MLCFTFLWVCQSHHLRPASDGAPNVFFSERKPSNRKHVLVHRWIKIKIRMWPFRGSMRKQRWLWLITSRPRQEVFFQEQKMTGTDLKKKKSLADQDEVAWGQSGREREMKGGQVRYIYIMWLKGRGGWSPGDRHSDVVGVERRLYTL